jgi:hypothetical protein
VAYLAETVSAIGHSFERGINFTQEVTQTSILRRNGNGRLQTLLPLFQLTAKKNHFLSRHDNLPHVTLQSEDALILL